VRRKPSGVRAGVNPAPPLGASLRGDFPALTHKLRGRAPVYLDSACTTLRAEPVIQAMASLQRGPLGCHGRSNHAFGRATSEVYEAARETVRGFLGAREAREIVFVRNTTEAINLVAWSFPWRAGDVVLTTDLEHNSNLLPWQRLARQGRVTHRLHRVDPQRGVDLDALARDLRGVRLLALPHVSNLLGLDFPLAEIARLARAAGAAVLVDGAQAVCTHPVDVAALGVDFYAFSFHKMFGPAGAGALYGRLEQLEGLRPFVAGGGTVESASYDDARFEPLPMRLEAGVGNYEAVIGGAAAVRYLRGLGQRAVHEHVVALNRQATQALSRLPRVEILGPREADRRGGILSFHVQGMRSEGLARMLDHSAAVMVRHGKLCVHPWFEARGVPDAIRVSFSAYNTPDEVRRFTRTLAGGVDMLG
jgi:cysteine desulfurase/selenocysteine lyase